MERNGLSTSLKYHKSTVINSPTKESSYGNYSNKDKMVKESWDCNSQSNGEDYLSGFSWPPRSYTCSFCKREFRSAQALGGHMNVHRRDRARLRQSPPTDGQAPILNLNLNPTSNTIFSTSSMSLLSSSSSSSSSSSTRLKPCTCTLPSLVSHTLSSSSSPSSACPEVKKFVNGILLNPLNPKASDSIKLKNAEPLSGFREYDTFARENGCKMLKKAEIITLDLDVGLLSDSKEDLDLELRLGTYP
ncbi:hypothetical protein L6164_025797 [Bauhinia variegata]|uniref:Uncharacterized protein n=1 Tax=Bauhinia variegata TaxID=167791 RepID=A0ACB9M334_BAUVA|nr:hypothetical protein L6164_025797 [Bauhinia variegata]